MLKQQGNYADGCTPHTCALLFQASHQPLAESAACVVALRSPLQYVPSLQYVPALPRKSVALELVLEVHVQ